MPFFDENSIDDYIKKAVANANVVNAIILGEGIEIPVKEEEVKPEEAEPEEEEKKEEGTTGISGLFG